MAYKGLIVYASHTGNTEKVALSFKKAFDKNGWQCDMLKMTKKFDRNNPPYFIEDYNLVCVGSPIIGGVPTRDIQGLMAMKRTQGKDWHGNLSVDVPFGKTRGIAFVTYSGCHTGGAETEPALALIKNRMEVYLRVKCIGKFACPGKTWIHYTIDGVSAGMKWDVDEASSTIARYRENPNSPEFASMTAEQRKVFEDAIADKRDIPEGYWNIRPWHPNQQERPLERDLVKAEIFMEEIIEDYYGGGLEAATVNDSYVCIA